MSTTAPGMMYLWLSCGSRCQSGRTHCFGRRTTLPGTRYRIVSLSITGGGKRRCCAYIGPSQTRLMGQCWSISFVCRMWPRLCSRRITFSKRRKVAYLRFTMWPMSLARRPFNGCGRWYLPIMCRPRDLYWFLIIQAQFWNIIKKCIILKIPKRTWGGSRNIMWRQNWAVSSPHVLNICEFVKQKKNQLRKAG